MATDITSLFGGVAIGKDTSNKFKLSLNGLAIQVSDTSYRAYDPKKQDLLDAITFDLAGASNLIYRVPVPVHQLKKGDIIIVKDQPFTAYFVVDDPAKGAKAISVMSPDGIATEYYPPISQVGELGSAFVVRVTSPIGRPGAEFPLEKLLPFLVLSDKTGSGGSGQDLLSTLALANYLGIGGKGEGHPLSFLAMGKGGNLGALALLLGNQPDQPQQPAQPAQPAQPPPAK
jgi:hypothetical protein